MIKRFLYSILVIIEPIIAIICGGIGLAITAIYVAIELALFIIIAYPYWIVTGKSIFKYDISQEVLEFTLLPLEKISDFLLKVEALCYPNPKITSSDSSNAIHSYRWMPPRITNLPVDVYIDDSSICIKNRHAPILFARNGYDCLDIMNRTNEFIPILISKKPKILDEKMTIKIQGRDLDKVLEYVKTNREKLIRIARMEMEANELD